MKKSKMILGGLTVFCALSVSAIAADEQPLSVEERYQMLEEDLQVLEAKEQDMFNEEEAKAATSAQNLESLKQMRVQVAGRVKAMQAESKKSMFPKEMQDLAKQYNDQLKQIDDQIKVETKVVTDWNKLKALRSASIIK